MTKQSIHFSSSICGIPCGIHIDSYIHVPPFKGSPQDCDNPDDYYGYIEAEYTILDRKGYPAEWLMLKLNPAEHERIVKEITAYRQSEADEALDYDHDSSLDDISDKGINVTFHKDTVRCKRKYWMKITAK